jgi:hypothetical protein
MPHHDQRFWLEVQRARRVLQPSFFHDANATQGWTMLFDVDGRAFGHNSDQRTFLAAASRYPHHPLHGVWSWHLLPPVNLADPNCRAELRLGRRIEWLAIPRTVRVAFGEELLRHQDAAPKPDHPG